jgi:hypothetical protein
MLKGEILMRLVNTASIVAILALAVAPAAVLAAGVDSNLGALPFGATPFSATTLGADNDIDTYGTPYNNLAIWNQDYIFQFTLSAPGVVSFTSNDPDGPNPGTQDNDFFLLPTLTTTTTAGGLRQGASIAPATGTGYTSANYGTQPAGTYYFVVDAFQGAAATLSAPGPVTGTITITDPGAPIPPPPSTPVTLGGSVTGTLAAGQVKWYSFTLAAPTAVSFDTEGTTLSGTNDTELFLYNSAGALLGTDDDDGTDNLSILNSGDELPATLAAGTYYLGFGAFNTTGAAGFGLTSASTQTGSFVVHGITAAVPEPMSLAALSMGGLLMRRRRA